MVIFTDIETDQQRTSVATAALQTLALACELLQDAADTLPPIGSAVELRQAIADASSRTARADNSPQGLMEMVRTSREIVRLCNEVAARNRRSSPVVLACARLAASSADLALEEITEAKTWTGGAALSRRARQLVEIHQLRDQTQRVAQTLQWDAANLPAHVEATSPQRRSE